MRNNAELEVIYEDDVMIVCNKPSGILAQGNHSFDMDMVSMVMTYRRKKGEEAYAAVINRLDCPVSGLMVFAKTKEEAARLNGLLQKYTFNKKYYAVLCGEPKEQAGKLTDYLLKDGKNNMSQVVPSDTPGSKKAELEYEVIETNKTEDGLTLSLVRIHLITGRHHQIRVQFSTRGLPLLGDRKYGDEETVDILKMLNSRQIALCAYSLQIETKKFEIKPHSIEFSGFKVLNSSI